MIRATDSVRVTRPRCQVSAVPAAAMSLARPSPFEELRTRNRLA